MTGYDAVVVGAGVMGATTALWLARGGMRVALVDRDAVCREASGVNAGTLTLHMTRAALIPYALEGWRLWTTAADWLDREAGVVATPGLCLAFTAAEEALLAERSAVRREAGAPIEAVTVARALEIEPALNPAVRAVAHCPFDGHVLAHLTGRAYRRALVAAGVAVMEGAGITGVERRRGSFVLHTGRGPGPSGRRLVLAGGVWLEPMLGWLGVRLPIRTLVNQLVVTERLPPTMRTVLTIASGLLSLKQFANGTVLVGGGWQGTGDRDAGRGTVVAEHVVGNLRLAAWTVPALRRGRIVRAWTGFEAETADALPVAGPVPGVPDAWALGSVHSGYTSAPCFGRLLADTILGHSPRLPLFPLDRLLTSEPVPV